MRVAIIGAGYSGAAAYSAVLGLNHSDGGIFEAVVHDRASDDSGTRASRHLHSKEWRSYAERVLGEESDYSRVPVILDAYRGLNPRGPVTGANFEDGATLFYDDDEKGSVYGEYDLVVVASGSWTDGTLRLLNLEPLGVTGRLGRTWLFDSLVIPDGARDAKRWDWGVLNLTSERGFAEVGDSDEAAFLDAKGEKTKAAVLEWMTELDPHAILKGERYGFRSFSPGTSNRPFATEVSPKVFAVGGLGVLGLMYAPWIEAKVSEWVESKKMQQLTDNGMLYSEAMIHGYKRNLALSPINRNDGRVSFLAGDPVRALGGGAIGEDKPGGRVIFGVEETRFAPGSIEWVNKH